MALYFITRIFLITCFAIVSYAFPVTDVNDAALYLKKYGYLEEISTILDQGAISNAIKDFQAFVGLRKTGELDDDTIAVMNTPRCGVKDKKIHTARKKRYTLEGSTWPLNEITYRISNYPSSLTDNTTVKNEIARAFQLWSDVTPLKFKEKLTGQSDIVIRFVAQYHGDGIPFNGSDLAHAFYPQYGGNVHFWDEKTWTANETSGINLFQVAAHEFGHSLGVNHSESVESLMAPYYTTYIPGFQLHPDDIEAIQLLYGRPADPGAAPDLCQDATIDTITVTQSRNLYVFKGDFYWEVLPSGLAQGYPRKISVDWDGLEGDLDASVTWTSGKTYFFKGAHYWQFTNKIMDSGYPKLISEGFQGIPDNLNAALICNGNDITYFFKDDQYWRFDLNSNPHISWSYPQRITDWSNLLEGGIDGALPGENNHTYFFQGDQYYRYNDITNEVEDSYPHPTGATWFGCQ